VSAVAVHHVVSGPADAPVVVLSNSLGATRRVTPGSARLANAQQPGTITPAIIEHLAGGRS
jgi:hypothetical protein